MAAGAIPQYARTFRWPAYAYILEPTLAPVGGSLGAEPTRDTLLSNEYGKCEANLHLQGILRACNIPHVQILPITLANAEAQVAHLAGLPQDLVIVNLCDGCEVDGYPGLSVVEALTARGLPFTGSDVPFYRATTSKPVLKRMLQQHGVSTSPFVELQADTLAADLERAAREVGWPAIVKPAVSYASLSITDSSIVGDAEAARREFQRVFTSASGGGGVFVERFLAGREFTALCTGDARSGVTVHPVVERVFHPRLKTGQRILAFDRYWEGYDLPSSYRPEGKAVTAAAAAARLNAATTTTTATTSKAEAAAAAAATAGKEELYWYALAPATLQPGLTDLSRRAYLACGGSGYGRVDIRTPSMEDREEGVVLEVNANCGLTFQESTSSAAEILRLAAIDPIDFCRGLIAYALERVGMRCPSPGAALAP